MKKDAYYFQHFCNARNDSKILKLRRVMGIEGYGIYFMLLEVLREQTDFRLPLSSIEDLEFEFRISKEKIMAVISGYELFDVIDDKFFSPKLIHYLQPYIDKTQKAREAANERWGSRNIPKEITYKPAIIQFYLIRCFNESEQFLKIGTSTTSLSRRFNGKLPYEYEVLVATVADENATEDSVACAENATKIRFESKKYQPLISFSGDKKCYSIDCKKDMIEFLKDMLKKQSQSQCGSDIRRGEEIYYINNINSESPKNEIKENINMIQEAAASRTQRYGFIFLPDGKVSFDFDCVLPDKNINEVMNYFKAVKKIEISSEDVVSVWNIFRDRQIDASTAYLSEDDGFGHFFNWAKKQPFTKAKKASQKQEPKTQKPEKRVGQIYGVEFVDDFSKCKMSDGTFVTLDRNQSDQARYNQISPKIIKA